MYTWANYYGAGSAASGTAARTWFDFEKVAGIANGQYASVDMTSGPNSSNILYCSGFGVNLGPLANVASGVINVVLRSPSGVNITAHVHGFYAGPSLTLISEEVSYSGNGGHLVLPTGTTFLTRSLYFIPSGFDLNSSNFKLGILVNTEASGSVDVDSIYLSLYYQDRPKLYKTTSVTRTGSSFHLK